MNAGRHRAPTADAATRPGRQWADRPAAVWTRRALLGAVPTALAAFTLISRNWPLPGTTVSMAALDSMTIMPAQPSQPRTSRVPVRTKAAAGRSAVPGTKVMLRQLVIAADEDDPELPAWRTILDQIGTPYEVFVANRQALSADTLVRADGTGRYNAILLTSNTLAYRSRAGQYVSAFDDAEWEALWDYERAFRVRQVALNAAPGEVPEDYYLRARSEGAVGTVPVLARLTKAGTKVFDYLSPAIRIPISGTYVYRTSVATGGDARPLLTVDSAVLGVLSTAADGRERAALTFVLSPTLPVTSLLGYGLLRWATRGIFLGEQRHWLNVDVDDWFNADVTGWPQGLTGAFRLSGSDAAAVSQQQAELRRRYPLAAGFTLNLAYNGGRLDPSAPAQSSAQGTSDPLTSYSRSLRHEFRWINHTLTHPAMNFTPYHENYQEIRDNLVAAALIGLEVPGAVLKPPEYSGLGVYNPHSRDLPSTALDPIQIPGPVTDFGLHAANKALLKAASDLGVRYIAGDMSFRSEQPDSFNSGIYIPLQPDLLLVPTWPTNIAFEATTQQEQLSWYNSMYGVHGSLQRNDRDFGYGEYLAAEAELALGQVMRGSVYPFTVHQTNLHQFAPGRSLLFDWLNLLVAKYSAYYRIPLKNPDWLTLADYVHDRTTHFKALASGPDAVWDRRAGTVSYTPAADTVLFVTGLVTRPATGADQQGPDQAEKYGSDTVSRLGLTGGKTVTFAVSAAA